MERGGVPCGLGATESCRRGRVHVVGLGGSGVRGIVPLLLERGWQVSGSDAADSPALARLRRGGVRCWVGHSDAHVDPGTNLMLISAAVTPDNPEVVAAEQQRIPVVKYAECLGLLMAEKQGIAVAGTHGKTTTTAMTCFTLLEAGRDPSFVIGGEHPDLGGSSRSGGGSDFVAEACEFDRSFLHLRPRAAVVTNIEEDHLDYFGSLEDIRKAFRDFSGLLPRDGLLVQNADDPNSAFLGEACRARVEGFSLRPGGAAWSVERLETRGTGSRFLLRGPGGLRRWVALRVPGTHNVRNAVACIALCVWAGVPVDTVIGALGRFRGVRRRFDVLRDEGCTVVDDYAHHPTEVETVLRSARDAYPGRRLVCVFQPHQYSRLRKMKRGFADALREADHAIVLKVYRARDTDEDARSVRADHLARAVRRRGVPCRCAPSFPKARRLLDETVAAGDVVLFLGAGDVTELAHQYAAAGLRPVPRLHGDSVPVRQSSPAGLAPAELAG